LGPPNFLETLNDYSQRTLSLAVPRTEWLRLLPTKEQAALAWRP